MSKFFPNLYLKSVYNIDLAALKTRGINVMLCDIDNTLAPHHEPYPTKKVISWIKKVSDFGIKTYIISNNNHKRVSAFCEKLPAPFICMALKPLKHGFSKILKELNVMPQECCMVGDQIFSDIWGANRLGIYSILVEKLTDKEAITVKLKRIAEKRVLKSYGKSPLPES